MILVDVFSGELFNSVDLGEGEPFTDGAAGTLIGEITPPSEGWFGCPVNRN